MTPLPDLIHQCARQSSTDDLAEWLAENMGKVVMHLNPQPDIAYAPPAKFMISDLRWFDGIPDQGGRAPRTRAAGKEMAAYRGWMGSCWFELGSRNAAAANWTLNSLPLLGLHHRGVYLHEDGLVETGLTMFADDFVNLAVMRRLQGLDLPA